MRNKWTHRVYVDLFSGPGKCVVRESSSEIDGSPLIAARLRNPFTELYLNDGNQEAGKALAQRLESVESPSWILNLECNAAARAIRGGLAERCAPNSTLGLAFIDPSAFQIGLDSIAALTEGYRFDLIVTVMTGYIKRFVAHPSYADAMDRFFGSSEWREFVDVRARGQRVTYGALLQHYEDRLRSIGYPHVNDLVRMPNTKGQTVYHLVFASKDPLGEKIFNDIAKRGSGQRRLL